jgi:hypothetical protein
VILTARVIRTAIDEARGQGKPIIADTRQLISPLPTTPNRKALW